MGSTVNYTANNVGTDALTVLDSSGTPVTATVSATAGGLGVGVITIELPAGYFRGGGFRLYSKVVRPLKLQDYARYGGTVTNIDADGSEGSISPTNGCTWLW